MYQKKRKGRGQKGSPSRGVILRQRSQLDRVSFKKTNGDIKGENKKKRQKGQLPAPREGVWKRVWRSKGGVARNPSGAHYIGDGSEGVSSGKKEPLGGAVPMGEKRTSFHSLAKVQRNVLT